MPHERKLGNVAGPIVIKDDLGLHDLHDSIWIGPTGASVDLVKVISQEVKYILLVEKQSIFNRLVEDQFHRKNSCLLATGNGYPGRSFHMLLRNLSDQLCVPLYVLADNDPPGYMFYFLIARGTVKRIGKPNKERRIRDARFLGLRVDDWERIGFRRDDVGIRLSDVELGILNHLKSCPWLVSNHLWQREFDQMLQAGFKVEMEAMTTIGESYLADTYLPQRIKGGSHFQVFS